MSDGVSLHQPEPEQPREIASFRQALVDVIDTYTYALATQAGVGPTELDVAEAVLEMPEMQAIKDVLRLVRHARGPAGHACTHLPPHVLAWVLA